MIRLVIPFSAIQGHMEMLTVAAIDGELIMYDVPEYLHDEILQTEFPTDHPGRQIPRRCFTTFQDFVNTLTGIEQLIVLDEDRPLLVTDIRYEPDCYIVVGCDVSGLPQGIPDFAMYARIEQSDYYINNLPAGDAVRLTGLYAYWQLNGLLN